MDGLRGARRHPDGIRNDIGFLRMGRRWLHAHLDRDAGDGSARMLLMFFLISYVGAGQRAALKEL